MTSIPEFIGSKEYIIHSDHNKNIIYLTYFIIKKIKFLVENNGRIDNTIKEYFKLLNEMLNDEDDVIKNIAWTEGVSVLGLDPDIIKYSYDFINDEDKIDVEKFYL